MVHPIKSSNVTQSMLSVRAITFFSNIFGMVSTYLWLYSPCGPWPLFQFLTLYIVGRVPWTEDQPIARPLPTHRTTQTHAHRHPCLEWDPNPRSQCLSGRRRFMTWTTRPLWSALVWYTGPIFISSKFSGYVIPPVLTVRSALDYWVY
jgi:hypothetical protein